MPWPAPGQPGSFEASRGPQSWGGSRRGRWDREGQRSPAEGRTCSVVQPHREALHDEKKYRLNIKLSSCTPPCIAILLYLAEMLH